MSGGVDSSTAAALLKSQGYQVSGVTMKVWDKDNAIDMGGCSDSGKHACYGPGEEEEILETQKIADKIGIPLHIIDVSKEYGSVVLDYFRQEYLAGRTPNPCVMCNHRIKFGFLAQKAEMSGIEFDYFATGHYVQIHKDPETRRLCIKKGADKKKDQSYFLAFLSQKQLERVTFPLGAMTKEEVRQKSSQLGLSFENVKESQDFIEGGDYSVLFDTPPKPGAILSVDGKVIGEHKGIYKYTVGQRKGLGVSHPKPLYVTSINPADNTIVAAEEEHLYTSSLTAGSVHWMLQEKIESPVRANVKLRLTHPGADALVEPAGEGRVKVAFHTPQKFVTPGQAAVFYEGDLILGAGIIQ